MNDELKHLLATASNDKQKIDILNDATWDIRYTDPQHGLQLVQEAHHLVTTGDFKYQPYHKGLAYSLRNLAEMNYRLSHYDTALSYALKALSWFEELNLPDGIMTTLRIIGGIHYELGNYSKTLELLLQSLEISQEIGDKYNNASALSGIGIIYNDLEYYQQALQTFQRCMQICQAINDEKLKAVTLNNMTIVYCNLKDYDKSLQMGYQSLQIAQKEHISVFEGYVLESIGKTYFDMGNYEKAFYYFQQCLDIAERVKNKSNQVNALRNIGKIYHKRHDTNKALSYLHKSLDIAQEIDSKPEIFVCHEALVETYKERGDFQKALYHHEQFHNIEKTVFNEKADKKLKLLQVIHETETSKREAEIYQLKNVALEKEITERKHAEKLLKEAHQEIVGLNRRLEEENVRLETELKVARQIQKMLLPTESELRKIEELDIAGFMQPADEVGGDYYDVLEHNGLIKIAIGDVTGHGLESGLVMLMTQTAVRTLLTSDETNHVRFLSILNHTIYDNIQRMKTHKYLTLTLLDYQAGELRLSGKHEDVILVRQGGIIELIDTSELGFPIGMIDPINKFIGEITMQLQSGEGIVLYTDGITEAENMQGKFYGLEQLCDMVSQNWHQSAKDVKTAIVADVQNHIGEQKVYDDLTLLVIKLK
ncbi:MAG: hypothetical protein B6242_08425 [Anaerolineaceae bacterium 4572_78]|nr:MAG: hypothetical protein B6242_08425 [Anaerolineaceae bacterium 4572_78]